MKTISADNLFYLDESGFDIEMEKEYGWSVKNTRLLAERSGNRKGKRVSVIAVRNYEHKLLCPFYFVGSTNKEVFKTYLTKVLLPFLPKNAYLIMDNASFHKGEDLEMIIKNYKINLLYLPTYSPDLNPIEKKWAQIKSYYRKFKTYFQDKMKLIEQLLLEVKVSIM